MVEIPNLSWFFDKNISNFLLFPVFAEFGEFQTFPTFQNWAVTLRNDLQSLDYLQVRLNEVRLSEGFLWDFGQRFFCIFDLVKTLCVQLQTLHYFINIKYPCDINESDFQKYVEEKTSSLAKGSLQISIKQTLHPALQA